MEILNKYKWYILCALISMSIGYFLPDNKETIKEDEPLLEEKILVDIKGAVNNPGVYELSSNSRVEDALLISGGVREDADISVINLSKKLNDEDVIIIYSINEINEMKSGATSVKIVDKECTCPKISNVACISKTITNVEETNYDGKMSINEASVTELETLPGIGSSKAEAIISYRKSNGEFTSIEEIKNVKGIGEALFDKIKDYITI